MRWPPRPVEMPERYSARAQAFLKYGRVQLTLDYQIETVGFLEEITDAEGRKIVVYDTRPDAAERFQQLRDEVEAMLASLQVGHQSASQPAGPMPEPARIASEDTTVRLVAAKTEAEPGEFVEIKAVLDNAKGDEGELRYEWGGNHAGDGDTVTFFASDLGEYDITVIVRGAKGVVGATSVAIRVR